MGVAHLSKIKMFLSSFHTEWNTPQLGKGFYVCSEVLCDQMSTERACKMYAHTVGRVHLYQVYISESYVGNVYVKDTQDCRHPAKGSTDLNRRTL